MRICSIKLKYIVLKISAVFLHEQKTYSVFVIDMCYVPCTKTKYMFSAHINNATG